MSSDSWWYENAGQRVGPFAKEDLSGLVRAGLLKPDTKVINQDGCQSRVSAVLASDTSGRLASAPEVVVENAPYGRPAKAPSVPPPPPPPPLNLSCEKPPELPRTRFVIAILVCLLEIPVLVAISMGLLIVLHAAGLVELTEPPWRRLGWLLAGLILMRVLPATWLAITGENIRTTKALNEYRKFGRGPVYNQGFVAGRSGLKWDELQTDLREQDEYFRGYQDGLCFTAVKERTTRE